MYSIDERIEIVTLFYKNNDCVRAAARMFKENYRDINVGYM